MYRTSLFQAFRSWGQRKEMWAEKKKKQQQQQQQQQRGGGEGVRARDSLFSPVFFFLSLPSRRTPLSERPGQASTEPNA